MTMELNAQRDQLAAILEEVSDENLEQKYSRADRVLEAGFRRQVNAGDSTTTIVQFDKIPEGAIVTLVPQFRNPRKNTPITEPARWFEMNDGTEELHVGQWSVWNSKHGPNVMCQVIGGISD